MRSAFQVIGKATLVACSTAVCIRYSPTLSHVSLGLRASPILDDTVNICFIPEEIASDPTKCDNQDIRKANQICFQEIECARGQYGHPWIGVCCHGWLPIQICSHNSIISNSWKPLQYNNKCLFEVLPSCNSVSHHIQSRGQWRFLPFRLFFYLRFLFHTYYTVRSIPCSVLLLSLLPPLPASFLSTLEYVSWLYCMAQTE